MKKHLETAVTAVVLSCALLVTGFVVRRELVQGKAPSHVIATVADWRSYAEAGHEIGTPGANVSVVVFSDFQCPYCALLARQLRDYQRSHPGRISVKFRHFPIPGHPYARLAAQASECAARQDRFAAYHDALFDSPEAIGSDSWLAFARTAAVPDTTAFTRCLSEPDSSSRIARDVSDGRRLHMHVTPTLLINNILVAGRPSPDEFERLVAGVAVSNRR